MNDDIRDGCLITAVVLFVITFLVAITVGSVLILHAAGVGM